MRRTRKVLLRSPLPELFRWATRRAILHCFGDSHARVFSDIEREGLLPRTWFDVTVIGGATALGMANPNSRTQALPTFLRVIRNLPRHRPLVFLLGEVDCGYLIWYRARTRGTLPEVEMRASLFNYTSFLTRIIESGHNSVVLVAAPPPTILEGQDWGEVANLRREVRTSLGERTEMTRRYNRELADWSLRAGCCFIDYESEVLDQGTGIIREVYRSPDALDHHLAQGPFALLLANHFRDLGYS